MGKHRRTRCDSCKRLFQFGVGTHKVTVMTLRAIEKRVYCCARCAIKGIDARKWRATHLKKPIKLKKDKSYEVVG